MVDMNPAHTQRPPSGAFVVATVAFGVRAAWLLLSTATGFHAAGRFTPTVVLANLLLFAAMTALTAGLIERRTLARESAIAALFWAAAGDAFALFQTQAPGAIVGLALSSVAAIGLWSSGRDFPHPSSPARGRAIGLAVAGSLLGVLLAIMGRTGGGHQDAKTGRETETTLDDHTIRDVESLLGATQPAPASNDGNAGADPQTPFQRCLMKPDVCRAPDPILIGCLSDPSLRTDVQALCGFSPAASPGQTSVMTVAVVDVCRGMRRPPSCCGHLSALLQAGCVRTMPARQRAAPH